MGKGSSIPSWHDGILKDDNTEIPWCIYLFPPCTAFYMKLAISWHAK